VRKASLGTAEQRSESLGQAEAQLQKIIADKKLSSLHAASVRLLNLVRLRAHPAERMHELAQILSRKTTNPNLKQDLWDYTVLFDSFWGADEAKLKELPRNDDLTDWILTLEDQAAEATNHAISRWQATHANTWLIAALSSVNGKDAKAGELIPAALNVKNTSGAFVSARFHAIRLLIEGGKNAEARALVDQTLKTERARLDESTLNLLLNHRMMLANNLTEFLADAARVPTTLSWNDDGREIPAEDSELSPETKTLRAKPYFDESASEVLNQMMPLAILKQAAKSNALPPHLQQDLVQATWLRAVMLGDTKTADELTPVLSNLVPELGTLLNSYLSARPDEKRFAAVYAWLKFPGMQPLVNMGIGRQMPLGQQDSYRDNWWCAATYHEVVGEDDADDGLVSFTAVRWATPPFLSAAETQKARSEWDALGALGAGPNYISKTVIEWANRSPEDPRVPESLHLAVKTTRYGCADANTGRWSKAAFDLLHRKYPNSSWARKTPYWFKE
jgi:hypothetical protein